MILPECACVSMNNFSFFRFFHLSSISAIATREIATSWTGAEGWRRAYRYTGYSLASGVARLHNALIASRAGL